MIADRIHEEVPNFECQICGIKLNRKKMNDLIIFAHGNIGNGMEENAAFKEITQTIYIHKHCMKSLINKKFSNVVREFFSNSI